MRILVFPEVGMGATISIGSDRYAATIIAVTSSGKTVVVQGDKIDADGKYVPNPQGELTVFRQCRKNPDAYRNGSRYLDVGERESYRDPSF